MEQYIVSARKYRPSTFSSVVGQGALTLTLKNAIATDRLAHAYLFCGSRGVGKTSCARIFAKTINCSNRSADGEACNECDSCRQFNENRSLNIIELDAASHNGIDDMKALIEQVMVPPTIGKYRVFIIDEVHMLSASAFNAFLKTLEEPPSYVIFILATTEKHKIIPTILSRCQIYDFNRITVADMVAHLAHVASSEGIKAEPEALTVIARKADGAMRDALSIFDQVAASSRGDITYSSTIENLNILDSSYYVRLVDAFAAHDVPSALLIYKEVREKGFDSQFFINGLALYLRDLMVACDPSTIVLLETDDAERARLAEKSAKFHPTFLYKAMDICNDADFNFRMATNKQFLIELTLIKLCQAFSPSSDKSGCDGGQLKPLKATHTGTDTLQQQPVSAEVKPQPQIRRTAPTPVKSVQAPHLAATAAPKLSLKAVRSGTASSGMAAESAAEYTAAGDNVRRNPYDDAAIAAAWTAYIKSHPTEHVIINMMRSSRPQPSGVADRYVLTVENGIILDMFNQASQAIHSFMRDALGNDAFTIEAVESNAEPTPDMWTESQVMAYIAESQPGARTFFEKHKLHLI